MKDITRDWVQVVIDNNTIWLNDMFGCIVRISKIRRIDVDDGRTKK